MQPLTEDERAELAALRAERHDLETAIACAMAARRYHVADDWSDGIACRDLEEEVGRVFGLLCDWEAQHEDEVRTLAAREAFAQ